MELLEIIVIAKSSVNFLTNKSFPKIINPRTLGHPYFEGRKLGSGESRLGRIWAGWPGLLKPVFSPEQAIIA